MPAVAKLEERQLQRVSFQRILFATDFSEASQRAFPYAVAMARRYGSKVLIVHALAPEPREFIPLDPTPHEIDRRWLQAEQQMADAAKDARVKGIAHRFILEQGPVWDVLASVIQREDIDMLVVGTHGRGGVRKLVLGSVAEEVLRRAPCPVLTIGKNVVPGSSAFRSILFATDFGAAAAKALHYAVSLAEEYGSKLILLHMVPPMPALETGPGVYGPALYAAEELTQWQAAARRESTRKLRELLPTGAKLAQEPECVVGTDSVPEGILDAAKSRKADLIVMGANRTSSAGATAHAPWTVTHTVVCESTCPVLTVAG